MQEGQQMSDETNDTTAETEATSEKKVREPKRNSIPSTEVAVLTEGIPQYTKTSFLVVGHKDGVRIALPLTSGVSRAYFYGNGDYSLIPQHDAISVFTEEQRKEQRKGGIMAEVDFEKGLDQAREALVKLIAVVRAAPAPAPKALAKPKAPKKPKAVAVAPGESVSDVLQGAPDDSAEPDAKPTVEA